MADIPIMFSAPMVRALLDGRKTMTRRKDKSMWRRLQPGDRLWVRERYAPKAVGWYFETDTDGTVRHAWRNPMYMPRALSRLTLVVTGIKVEPLQWISEADAAAEGWERSSARMSKAAHRDAARDWFRDIWESLYGVGAWDANPPVVAISFTVHQCNIDAMQERAA